MHVFVVTQYYPPERGAAASRWGDYVDILIKHNYKVTVLCEAPHYPNNKYYPGFKNSWLNIEKKSSSLTILRTKAFASNRKNTLKKLTHYFVFMFSAIVNSRHVKKYDILIVSAPPLFTGIVGMFIKKITKKDFWLDIRDLWPDSALELNQISKGINYSIGKKIEYYIYKSAKGFIFPVPGFKKYLSNFPKEISDKPMFELMNGVSENFLNLSKKSIIKADRKFTVLYSGNMGYAQDLKTIIECAELLNSYDIYFRFIGQGVCRNEVEYLSRGLRDKVQFHEPVKREDLINWIKKSSVCLVPLKNLDLFKSALPSKMFEYMACEKPIIISVKGDASKLVLKSKSGIAIQPESASDLSNAILTYFSNKEKRYNDGQNGLKFVEENLKKESLILSLMESLKN
tara:strand:- start:594 stop:1793 length:1200 start_codon:yes stop_codon:yes gene_type:complete